MKLAGMICNKTGFWKICRLCSAICKLARLADWMEHLYHIHKMSTQCVFVSISCSQDVHPVCICVYIMFTGCPHPVCICVYIMFTGCPLSVYLCLYHVRRMSTQCVFVSRDCGCMFIHDCIFIHPGSFSFCCVVYPCT